MNLYPLSWILDLAMPRPCALCGGEVPSAKRYPLCDRCEEGLPRVGGRRCPRCGKELISERILCMRCRTAGYAFDSAWPLFHYAGTARELVVSYKLRGRRSLASFFAEELDRVLDGRYPSAVVVPVPPRPGKLRRRGWDQVEDLARVLECRFHRPVSRLLFRKSSAAEQKALGAEARRRNIRGSFSVRSRVDPALPYLLVDDVFTTGATLGECAQVLKAAGATRVDAVVLAMD